MDGLLIVDKPSGPTSHDIVACVRRTLGERRIGHGSNATNLQELILPYTSISEPANAELIAKPAITRPVREGGRPRWRRVRRPRSSGGNAEKTVVSTTTSL